MVSPQLLFLLKRRRIKFKKTFSSEERSVLRAQVARLSIGIVVVFASGLSARAEDGTQVDAVGGKLKLVAPESWKAGPKRSRILEHEFFAPADAKDADSRARITMMSSGGSIDANIQRWYGQFSQPDGKATKDVAKVEKFDVDGQTVHLVDISGDFTESMGGGPFAPGKKVLRKDHRMLGAIVVSKDVGQYFIKMTGPKAVCEKLADGFKDMLRGLKVRS